jgi:flagellar hook protein FlgE
MGIYGALSTAVTGLRAQSFALENVSGNIANSQTTGFKRIDTDFVDLIPDAATKRQTAGSVLAQSRSTNNVQGDVKGTSTETNMAINGNGFFVVEPAIGQSDGASVFSGANYYTRRGDFELDKSGYLVNGAGYYLKGLPIDPQTQNVSGSVPQVLQISNAFLPAHQTTRVNYEINLPQLPKTPAYNQSQASGSELLDARDFLSLTPDTAAVKTGATALGTDASTTIASPGDTLRVRFGPAGGPYTTDRTYAFNSGGSTTMPDIDISDAATDTVAEVLAAIQADLQANGATGATVTLNGDGEITITAGNDVDNVNITDQTIGSTSNGFGLADGDTAPTVSDSAALAARVNTISANDIDDFFAQSISGGAITVYAGNGAPANVQMRWAKVNSNENGGAERWNLFVLTNANATGTGTAWTRMGGDYQFGNDGSPNPTVEYTDLPNLTVNGVTVGDVRLQHGQNGLTQFADPNGVAEVTTLNQNGYAAGEYVSVAVNDNGRVVVSYNNGQQLEVAQVVTANFNAVNQLKRMDGGVFAATSESGEPILDNGGGIIGSSLEASNTDISEEFTKLIVTQQAYAAGTRIVSTADQMLQDALNMIR